MSKKKIGVLSLVSLIAIALIYLFTVHLPYQEAANAFNSASTKVEKANQPLQSQIEQAFELLKEKKEPLDPKTLDDLENTTNEATKQLRDIPEMASSASAIKEQTKELEKPIELQQYHSKVTKSFRILRIKRKTVGTNHTTSQEFIERRLKEIPTITEIQSVTKTNDPNGLLNKQGGYTASVYFADQQVSGIAPAADLVEAGNEAGGNIEVYSSKEDAEKRNDYLSTFDGNGLLNPGSHYVYGTLIIRTSDRLTASQQKNLTDAIYQKLIELQKQFSPLPFKLVS